MFELYTYEAIYALNEALKLAQNSSSQCIEPEHILLGLRKEGVGSAARFLRAKNISFDDLNKHFNQRSDLNSAVKNLEWSSCSLEILNSIYQEAKASNRTLVGQKELFLKLVENNESVSAVLKKLDALPTEQLIDRFDSPAYETDLNLPIQNPILMQKLEAFDLFEMSCLHSAFIYTGAFRDIVIKNLDATPKEILLDHLQQKYVVHGDLVVCGEDVSAEPIRVIFGHTDMSGWSWDEDEIEFSLVPEKFRDTRLKIAVLDFMADIAKLLGVPISLSDEGLEKDPWIVLHPDGSLKIPESVVTYSEGPYTSHFDHFIRFQATTRDKSL